VLAAELTADHVKCFAMNGLFGKHEGVEAVESSMASSFGWRMHLPADPARAGLELVGSRQCMYGEGEIAHIMYRHDGHPVSLFMLPKSARTKSSWECSGTKPRSGATVTVRSCSSRASRARRSSGWRRSFRRRLH
jgi:hypothetical protein